MLKWPDEKKGMEPVIKLFQEKLEPHEILFIIVSKRIMNGEIRMEAPSEYREFHNLMQRLTPQYGVAMVFDDLLDYIIAGFTIDKSVTWDKNYDKSEIQVFWLMYLEFLQVMEDKCQSET